jgi:hypothetical protein
VNFMKHFKGGASSKSLGTYRLLEHLKHLVIIVLFV